MRQDHIQNTEIASSLTTQLGEAGILMAVGMISVFIFLSILIIAMNLLSRFVKKFPGTEKPLLQPKNSVQTTEQPSGELVAAITAAVHQYRKNT